MRSFGDKKKRETMEDPPMDYIVEILRSLPEEEIPEQFNTRWGLALHAAAQEENRPKKPVYLARQRWRVGIALVASFLVGIASATMYNNSMWNLWPDHADLGGGSEIAMGIDERKSREEETGDMGIAGVLSEPENRTLAADMMTGLSDELLNYEVLIDQYFAEQDVDIRSYSWDAETGQYRFEIFLAEPQDGQEDGKVIVLVGQEGVIHEQQSQESGEPIHRD